MISTAICTTSEPTGDEFKLFPEIHDDDPDRDILLQGYKIATKLRIYKGIVDSSGRPDREQEIKLSKTTERWKMWAKEFGHLLSHRT